MSKLHIAALMTTALMIPGCTSLNESRSLIAPGVEWGEFKYAAIYDSASGVIQLRNGETIGGSQSSLVGASMIEQKFAHVLMALGFEIVGDRESRNGSLEA